MYTLWNDYHSQVNEHTPHLTQLFCVCGKNTEDLSLCNFQVYNAVLLTTVAMLYVKSPDQTRKWKCVPFDQLKICILLDSDIFKTELNGAAALRCHFPSSWARAPPVLAPVSGLSLLGHRL